MPLKHVLIRQTFPEFPEPLVEALYGSGELRLFRKGACVVRTGEELLSTVILLSGSLKVYRELDKGKEFLITFLKPGSAFAVSICEDSPSDIRRSLMTFKAAETSHVLALGYGDKDRIAKEFHPFYKYVLKTAVQYHGFYAALIDTVVLNNLADRLSLLLKEMAYSKASKALTITHQEIADSLHVSREAVSRLLKKMEGERKVKLGHKKIELIKV